MPNMLQFVVIVDRAEWLAGLGMFTVARDHYLLGAEMAREAQMFHLEDAQLQNAAECHELAVKADA